MKNLNQQNDDNNINNNGLSSKNLIKLSNNKINEINNILDLDLKECENKNIDNILYIVKKPNIGLISEDRFYNEIVNNEVNNVTQPSDLDEIKKEKVKKSIIIENLNAAKNPHSEKENECDSEFYLVPYDSLKSTIKHCQTINKDIIKLTSRDYPKKAATIYKEYYLDKTSKSTPALNSRSLLQSKLDLNSYLDLKSIKKNKIPIKYINSSTPEFLNENNNKEGKKLSRSIKSHLNRAYYYNSINDNYKKYENDYDIKTISLGNLKFHTAFHRNSINNSSLMINGCGSKLKTKSAMEINKNENELTYEEKRLKPYHSYSSYSSILSSYPSYTYDVIIYIYIY